MPRCAGIYGKTETEDCHALTIGSIARYSSLQVGFTGVVRWLRGERETGSVGYTILPDAIEIAYSHQDRPHAYTVLLTYTRLVSGGRRPWWGCPTCGRRCGVLYLRGGALACRLCHDLAYPSQRTRIRSYMDFYGWMGTFATGRAMLAETAAELAQQSPPPPTATPPRRPGRPRTKRRYTRRLP